MARTDLIKGRLNVAVKRNKGGDGNGAYLVELSDGERPRVTVRLSFNEAARLWHTLDRMLVGEERFSDFLATR